MGKGDKYRRVDRDKFASAYDAIFGKRKLPTVMSDEDREQLARERDELLRDEAAGEGSES